MIYGGQVYPCADAAGRTGAQFVMVNNPHVEQLKQRTWKYYQPAQKHPCPPHQGTLKRSSGDGRPSPDLQQQKWGHSQIYAANKISDKQRDGSESVDPTLGKASSHATVFLIQYLFIIGWEVWKQNFCPSHLKAFKWAAVRFICIKIRAIKQSQFENFKTLIFHCKPTSKHCIALYIALYVYIAIYTVQYTCIYCNIYRSIYMYILQYIALPLMMKVV